MANPLINITQIKEIFQLGSEIINVLKDYRFTNQQKGETMWL